MNMPFLMIYPLLLFVLFFQRAQSCTCARQSLREIYMSESTNSMVRAHVVAYDYEKNRPGNGVFGDQNVVYYALRVEATYKGCVPSTFASKGLIFVQTSSSSVSCGITLLRNISYIIPLPKGFLPAISICDRIMDYRALSQESKLFLQSRRPCCNGVCRSIPKKNDTSRVEKDVLDKKSAESTAENGADLI